MKAFLLSSGELVGRPRSDRVPGLSLISRKAGPLLNSLSRLSFCLRIFTSMEVRPGSSL